MRMSLESVWFATIFLANFRIESFSLVSPATRTLGAPEPNLNFSLLLDTVFQPCYMMSPRTIGMYCKDNQIMSFGRYSPYSVRCHIGYRPKNINCFAEIN